MEYIATGYLSVNGREYTPGEIVREEIDEEREAFLLRANVLRIPRTVGEGRKADPAGPAEGRTESAPKAAPARKEKAARKAAEVPEENEETAPPDIGAEEDEEPAAPPEVGAEEVIVRKGRKRK